MRSSGGTFAYGGYPEIDGLFREQSTQLDRAKREATLHRIQQLVQERAMVAPIYELAFLTAVGRGSKRQRSASSRLRVLRAVRGREAQGEIAAITGG